jgi:recombination protein RecA
MPRKKKDKEKDPAALAVDEIAAIVEETNKLFGKGTMGTLRGKFANREASKGAISTGSVGIDSALGVGGLPRGRVVEIYGPEAGGKTTLTLHVIAECQKAGGVAAFIDAEHALTPEYAQDVGVDLEALLFNQPASGEDALDLVLHLVKSNRIDLIIVDSVAALTPQAELDADMDKMQVGLQARLMSKALRKLTAAIGQTGTTLVFINQVRMKIGVTWGSPETTPGGNALKFYSSVRMDVRRIGSLKRGDTVTGNRVKVKIVKNKLAPPFRQAEFDLIFGQGISWESELIDYGTACGAIEKSGAWYSYGGERIGQGREKVSIFLRDNAKATADIRSRVAEYLNDRA